MLLCMSSCYGTGQVGNWLETKKSFGLAESAVIMAFQTRVFPNYVYLSQYHISNNEGKIMPILPCTSKGKRGKKYGKGGHCYTGKNARSRALKQMRAIKASQSRRKPH